jgi:hypothetical protein
MYISRYVLSDRAVYSSGVGSVHGAYLARQLGSVLWGSSRESHDSTPLLNPELLRGRMGGWRLRFIWVPVVEFVYSLGFSHGIGWFPG